MILGVKEEAIAEFVTKSKGFQLLIIAIALIIFFSALGFVYGERLLPVTAKEKVPVESDVKVVSGAVPEGGFKENVFKAIFNAKVLGALFLLVIAIFAVILLTRERL